MAFTIENPKICFKGQFRCQLQIVSSLLINPSLWPSGVSCDVWDLLLIPWQDACEKHLLIVGVLLRMVRRLCLCPFGYWVVAVSPACPTSVFVAEGWGLRGRRPVSLHRVACASWASPCSLPSGKRELIQEQGLPLHFAACIGHTLKSLFLTGWSSSHTHLVSGKRVYWTMALWVEVRIYKGSRLWF